jgi:hypothetical protein
MDHLSAIPNGSQSEVDEAGRRGHDSAPSPMSNQADSSERLGPLWNG